MKKTRFQILNEALYSLGMLEKSAIELGDNDFRYLSDQIRHLKNRLESLKSEEKQPNFSKMA